MPAESTPGPHRAAPRSRTVLSRAVLSLTCLVALGTVIVFMITPGPASSAPRPAVHATALSSEPAIWTAITRAETPAAEVNVKK